MTAKETDEIEKIMSEIEELQKEMAPAAAPEASIGGVEEDILREIQAGVQTVDQGAGLEDTLTELKQEEAAGGMLAATTNTQEETQGETMSQTNGNGDGTLSLTLTGNMTLKLKYEFEGQEVTISFADQALRVQMTDGTEFKVPVTRGQVTHENRGTNVKTFKKAV